MRTRLPLVLASAAVLLASLTACDPVAPAPSDSAAVDTGSGGGDSSTTTDDDSSSDESDSGTGVTIAGTGSYAIPDEIPFGGYQLEGDPGVLPDGCTWSITGGSGTVAESNGAYVFITDIPEAETFTTNGCPDWEQFE